ncbi:MAG: M23 family metallopeptidase [Alphaproteobacteria bacterium]|nr:M23 family metallopeptidase [Alphaproteobacteria bacterium]
MKILKTILDALKKGLSSLKALVSKNTAPPKKTSTPLKPILQIRGQDASGSGAFGAPRKRKDGSRYKHQGIDIKSNPGQKIRALSDGIFLRKVDPYGDGKFSGMVIKDAAGNEQKIFYINTIKKVGDVLEKGQIMAIAQDVADGRDMTNHYHFEVRDKNKKLLDPNDYLKKDYKLV